MQLPIKISYRGVEKSDTIESIVVEYAARLERFCDHINRCDVAIEQNNHTHQKGNPFRCRIDVTVSPRRRQTSTRRFRRLHPSPGRCTSTIGLNILSIAPAKSRSKRASGRRTLKTNSCQSVD